MTPKEGHEAQNDAILNYLIARANDRYTLDAVYPPEVQETLKRETARIRNMLLFTLSVDYLGYPVTSMPAADLKHFLRMDEALRQLRTIGVVQRSGPEVRPTSKERHILAAFFRKYLHEPCKVLATPLDPVYRQISYISRYMDHQGAYKGSVYGLLQQYGLKRLGIKLLIDRDLLIPRVFSDDHATRRQLLSAIERIEKKFFVSLEGVEVAKTNSITSKMSKLLTLKHEPTELGAAYVQARAMAVVDGLRDKCPQHWKRVLGKCIQDITKRCKLSKADKRKGKAAVVHSDASPFPRRTESELNDSDWMQLLLYHVPDYYESPDSATLQAGFVTRWETEEVRQCGSK
jgi:hypothetical protein